MCTVYVDLVFPRAIMHFNDKDECASAFKEAFDSYLLACAEARFDLLI